MKNALIIGGLILTFLAGFFLSQKYNLRLETKNLTITPTEAESPTVTKLPTPTTEEIDETVSDSEKIKAALVLKHGWNPGDIIVTVSQNDGQFARGGVRETSSEVGGGMFLAVKSSGEWDIVFDGNGAPDCNLLKITYQFPKEMLVGVCD